MSVRSRSLLYTLPPTSHRSVLNLACLNVANLWVALRLRIPKIPNTNLQLTFQSTLMSSVVSSTAYFSIGDDART